MSNRQGVGIRAFFLALERNYHAIRHSTLSSTSLAIPPSCFADSSFLWLIPHCADNTIDLRYLGASAMGRLAEAGS